MVIVGWRGGGGREGTYEPCFYPCGPEEGRVVVPDQGVAGYEIGEGGGEEEEAG